MREVYLSLAALMLVRRTSHHGVNAVFKSETFVLFAFVTMVGTSLNQKQHPQPCARSIFQARLRPCSATPRSPTHRRTPERTRSWDWTSTPPSSPRHTAPPQTTQPWASTSWTRWLSRRRWWLMRRPTERLLQQVGFRRHLFERPVHSTTSFGTPCAFVDFFSNALWRAKGEACGVRRL